MQQRNKYIKKNIYFIQEKSVNINKCNLFSTLWECKQLFRHLERSYLLLLCVIGYNVVKWPHCELKRDLLYFLNICNNIIS